MIIQTSHKLYLGDARHFPYIEDNSVHLVVTSPPYWNLKKYNEGDDQLGHINDYFEFLFAIEKVWQECYRVLVPGGRLVCVVGDVCLSRKTNGRHLVVPLHADICVQCRNIGFDNLNPIIWHKISNANFEANTSSKFLGKPYEPNAIVKNDIEFILMQRKPGAYRKPTDEQRLKSKIVKEDFDAWFRQIWNVSGASTKDHPAPFALELANRLVRMFSFTGDSVLDPFCGSGTTMLAALKSERNSIGIEIDPMYCRKIAKRLEEANQDLFSTSSIEYFHAASSSNGQWKVSEERLNYGKQQSARGRRKTPPVFDKVTAGLKESMAYSKGVIALKTTRLPHASAKEKDDSGKSPRRSGTKAQTLRSFGRRRAK